MKCFYGWVMAGALSVGACGPLQAGPTAYVATDGAHVYPYDTWEKAASNLQAAVDAVDAGGTVWVTNGVYATGGATVFGMSNRVALTRAVTLQSVNGPDVTFIKGQGPLGDGAVRCAYVTNGTALVGFTLTNGFTHSSGDADLRQSGGGAWLDRGGTVSNCTFYGNSSACFGGGIYSYFDGTVQSCTVCGNTAGAGAGAFCNYGGSAQSCTFFDNTAYQGGGVYCNGGGDVRNCTVYGNTADESGGGFYFNSAGNVQNCMVYDNMAALFGGGIYFSYGGVVQNCTICGNTAEAVGGTYSFDGGTLLNTIVFYNTDSAGCQNIFSEGLEICVTRCCIDPDMVGEGNISSDPKFVNAAANDYRLQTNSPCIDAGLCMDWMSNATDLVGKPRVLNGTVDMGAFESDCVVTLTAGPNGLITPSGSFRVAPGQPFMVTVAPAAEYFIADVIVDGQSLGPSLAASLNVPFSNVTNSHTVSATFLARPTVTYVSTNGASLYPYDTWEKAAAVIQDAVDYVRKGGTVWVTNGVYAAGGATVYGMSNRVALTRPVALRSVNGPEFTFIRGQGPLGAGAVRCAYVTNGAALVGLTLTDGFTRDETADEYYERSGGGAWLDRGGTVSNCTVSGNSATCFGGGVFCFYDGWIQGCAVDGNTAPVGGGVFCCNGGAVRDCMVCRNTADHGGGFGLFGGDVQNCVVCNNSANDGGGVSCYYDGTVRNCTVCNNTAFGPGGGIYCGEEAVVAFINAIIYSNTGGSSPNVYMASLGTCFTACCTDPAVEGEGNIAADPLFVNAAVGDFRLQSGSPCVDAGINQAWMDGATDLDGKPRVIGGTADMGAYEADYCVITASADENGAIFPSGAARVLRSQTQTLTVMPDIDFYVADVLVDGQSQGPSSSLSITFSNVTNNHTVSATFLPCPAVAYVSTNGANVCPYDTWDKAAATIQDSVDVVHSGGTVWVTNGVYAAGGATVYGMSNRVALTRPVTLRSVNGPDVTFIKGQGPLGTDAVRCAYVTNGAALVGFTLTNGFTRTTGDRYRELSGGGAWLDRGGTVSNCFACGNTAYYYAGGVYCNYGGTVKHCVISGNKGNFYGGGVACYEGGEVLGCRLNGNTTCYFGGGVYCYCGGEVLNGMVSGNMAKFGGGIYCANDGTIQNCTVSGNTASDNAGGVFCDYGGTVVNTVIFANTGCSSSNIYAEGTGMSFTNCCTFPAVTGTGNISVDPLFVNAAAGDYRLRADSPAIDTGLNQTWMSGAPDLDGKPRILNGTVDMGAYEADCTVTVTAGPNGTVSPSGTFRAPPGQSLTITFLPKADYYAADVLVDGQSLGAMKSYTFENVTNDHAVSAAFLPCPAVTFASTNGASLYPYDTWDKAAAVIQDAVNVVHSGGTVWASNGVYATGGETVYGMSNRVALTRVVTLQSVHGPDVTFIKGQGPLGAGAVRCAFVINGAALLGFTLTNGFTRTAGDSNRERSGGGAWLDRGGTVSNCTVSGNSADWAGGGVFIYYDGWVKNSEIVGNTASNLGGGGYCLYGGTVQNSKVGRNAAYREGGGIYCDTGGTVTGNLISGNTAGQGGGVNCRCGGKIQSNQVCENVAYYGGGVYCLASGSSIQSCMIMSNTAAARGGGIFCDMGGNVQYCTVRGNSASEKGGGFCIQNTSSLRDNLVDGNTAKFGGGVLLDNGVIQNFTVCSNTASCDGGGVYSDIIFGSFAAIQNSTVYGNTAATNGGGVYVKSGTIEGSMINGNTANACAGGVYLNSAGTIRTSTVSGNTANDGGGVYCYQGGTIQSCAVSSNTANSYAGGVYCCESGTVQKCTVRGNKAAYRGGGVYCDQGGTVSSSISSGNTANDGGGFYCNLGGTVRNCTASGNKANYYGGGIRCNCGGTVVNTILYFNTASDSTYNINLYGTGMSFANCCTAPVATGTGNIASDPKFVNAASGDYRLQISSPCINTGINQSWMSGETDPDGKPRIVGGTADMGAYEAGYSVTASASQNGSVTPAGTVWVSPKQSLTVTVTPDADYYVADVLIDGQSMGPSSAALLSYTFSNVTNGHTVSATFLARPTVAYVSTNGSSLIPYDTWDKASAKIQDAADYVRAGGTVWVTNGVYATGGAAVYGMSNRVALTRAVTLQSVHGPEVTFIKGQGPLGAGAVRCAYLTNGAALVGFTLTNGFTRAAGDSYRERSGGGAWLDQGGTVSNCAFRGNTANYYGGGTLGYQGGTVRDCAFRGNTTQAYGAGAYCYQGGTVLNCTASGNTASTRAGGVYCHQGGTVQNCVVNGNTANDGGGLYCYQGGAVRNCTASGNTAYFYGGGVVCNGGGALANTIIYSNTASGSSSNVCTTGTGMSFTNCCTAPAVSGTGNIAADPKFVNATAGDYRLQANSPCIDAGINEGWMDGATDLDGKPRILYGTADIGAFEAGFTVTASGGPNGSVSPSGTVFVAKGQSLTVTVSPDADCYVADVLVDGQSMGPSAAPVLSYTFADEAACHTLAATFLARPTVTFVSTNGTSLYPYDTWGKAVAVIQDAVDALRSPGGTVWASNGVYAAGGATVYGMSNRVALTRSVTLQSVNGPDATFICGQGPLGAGAVRCAYITNGAALVGFTLTNSFTRTAGDSYRERSGGGAWLDRGGTISNCAFRGNTANYYGGGVYCVSVGEVQNGMVSGNMAMTGGGIFCDNGGTIQNCTVSGNKASSDAGGVYCNNSGTLVNTVIFANTGGSTSNVNAYGTIIGYSYCCTAPAVIGTGNIAADPLFVNAAAGDFRLQTNSPCIDAGLNQAWMSGTTDLDGNPRIQNGTVDMGAYEAEYTVTVTAGPNGNVKPSGIVYVSEGQSLTVTVTPDSDSYMADLLVDGQSMGPSGAELVNYTFSNVTNSHVVSATFLARPASAYVSTNGASLIPYDTWEKAAATIQEAVDYVRTGGTVWATNGVYSTGGATVYGMSNRVALTRPVTLQSVNGAEVTVICGQGPLGAGAVRCAYVTNGAALVGFTLTNGFTRDSFSADPYRERSGGGAWLDRGGTVQNCTASGNSASHDGGGLYCYYGGTVQNGTISGNTASEGGGIYNYQGGTVRNCTISGNTATYGGGIWCDRGGTVLFCTLNGNKAHNGGGGVYCNNGGTVLICLINGNNGGVYGGGGVRCVSGGTVRNCTVSGNTALGGSHEGGGGVRCMNGGSLVNTVVYLNTVECDVDNNVYASGSGISFANCCTTPAVSGTGNIAADPLFVNAAAGDYRLQTNSPCINAGFNEDWMAGATDLDGKPRVIHGTVDMGAYEAILPGWDEDADGLPDEWEWSRARTLTDLAPDADADGDGADNLAEYGADTDPFSGSSLLLLTSIIPEAGGTRVAWRGGRDAWQFLERSTNLSDGAAGWTAVYTNAPPTAFSAEALDATPAGGKAFYRVRAQR